MRAWPKIYTGILLLLLVAFHLQQHFNFPKVKPLKGAFLESEAPTLSWTNWFSGDFQNSFEEYQKEHFGYRSDLTRLHNQIHFSIYGQAYHKDIFQVSDGHLVGQEYLDSWQGLDREEPTELQQRAQRLASLNQYLQANGKAFAVVIAPDKVSTYPESFGFKPDSEAKDNNYHQWKKLLSEAQIPFIDFKRDYALNKEHAEYPLFPKTGIHWSVYGMTKALDSIADFISTNSQVQVPGLILNEISEHRNYRAVETDLEDALNLLIPLEKEALAYPSIAESKGEKPSILVVADSYFYEMYSSGLAAKVFDAPFFWYYHKTALKYDWLEAPRDPKDYSLDSLVAHTDVVLLMATTINLRDFPWAFGARSEKELGF